MGNGDHIIEVTPLKGYVNRDKLYIYMAFENIPIKSVSLWIKK